jgi:hypothetical protein
MQERQMAHNNNQKIKHMPVMGKLLKMMFCLLLPCILACHPTGEGNQYKDKHMEISTPGKIAARVGHVIDMMPIDENTDPVREAEALTKELKKYDESLYQKPRWLVLNKTDMLVEEDRKIASDDFIKKLGWQGKSFVISALTGEGCQALIYAIMDHLEQETKNAEPLPKGSPIVYDPLAND